MPRDPGDTELFGVLAIAGASPITHVTRGAPPFLLIHGDQDPVVPLNQSTRFQAALRAMDVQCDLLVIPNGAHYTGAWRNIPGAPDWKRQMIVWLDGALHQQSPAGQGTRPRAAPRHVSHPFAMAEEDYDILVCRGLNAPLRVVWPMLKHWN